MPPILYDLLSLFYPEVCPSCGNLLNRDEKTICLSCRFLMPKTGYEIVADNPIARMFWGRVRLNAVSACYFFAKKGRVQPLIHELKYKSNRDAGHFLGIEMAKEIIQSPLYEGVDFIVPVPLHPKKIKIRGYNQSEVIAVGMRSVMNKPINKDVLVRQIATASQTKKSREARWQNVKDIFVLHNPELFEGRHILLIDDVITTGSTIEACANVLLQAKGIKVSVAAAACAPS
ncbi:MAG: ComF family protein [Bacteroidetes bacterium]|nr:ComF family protein [Bacteroidota bacterium]